MINDYLGNLFSLLSSQKITDIETQLKAFLKNIGKTVPVKILL